MQYQTTLDNKLNRNRNLLNVYVDDQYASCSHFNTSISFLLFVMLPCSEGCFESLDISLKQNINQKLKTWLVKIY